MSAHTWRDRWIVARYTRTQAHRRGPIRADEIDAFSRLTTPQLDVLVSSLIAPGKRASITDVRSRFAWAGIPEDDLSVSVAVMWMMASAGVPFAFPLRVPPHARARRPGRGDHVDGI